MSEDNYLLKLRVRDLESHNTSLGCFMWGWLLFFCYLSIFQPEWFRLIMKQFIQWCLK